MHHLPNALLSCVLLLLLPGGRADGPGGHHHGAHHGDHGAAHHGDHGAAHHGDHGAAHHGDHGAAHHGDHGTGHGGDHGAAHGGAGHHGDHGADAPAGQTHLVQSNVQRPVSSSFSIQPEAPRSAVVARGPQDLAGLVATHPKLTTLKAAVEAAGLQETLASPGPFTVFAPTNLAFKKLPAGEVARLLGDPARLSKLLLRHLVPGTTMQGKNIPPGVTHLKTAGGDQISTTRDKFIQIKSKKASAYVVLFDVLASNGVLHAVDTVF